LALSVWATPTFAIAALATMVAALLLRHSPWRIMAGGAVGAVVGIAALFITGSFFPFLKNLEWVRTNYSEVNHVLYGSVVGGYSSFYEGASGPLDIALRTAIIVGVSIPAWLPLLCGVLVLLFRDRSRLFLYVCALSMLATASPRFDVGHIIFTAALFYSLAASYIPRARWLLWPMGAMAFFFLIGGIAQRGNIEIENTPVGRLRMNADTANTVRWLLSHIQPGERLFVYPYPPMVYFLTGAKNVSRFSFMHPGVFTVNDEQLATEDMLRRPPAKVLFMDISKEEFLRSWPSSDPERLQLRYLHSFVESHFQRIASFKKLHLYACSPPTPCLVQGPP
jgi:hypothetical protein